MERILIIEDEKDVNQLLAQNLQKNGYETVSVWNGPDGIRQLQNQHFDMVLLDLMLLIGTVGYLKFQTYKINSKNDP